jgi:hypothetical protein
VIPPRHLDLASWVLAGAFIAFVLVIAAAIASSFLQHRQPRREVGVLEAVFRLRQEQLITAGAAEEILGRYDTLEREWADAR